MLTSSIGEILQKYSINENTTNIRKNDFFNSVYDLKTSKNITKDSSFTYSNIKDITLEEIDTLFKTENDKQTAKNLRLATLFSSDLKMSHALFDVVLGKPFNIGHEYLYNRYEDKHLFLSNNNNSLSDLLHESIQNRHYNDDIEAHEVISKERLNEVLLEVNSFNFIDSLTSTSKDLFDRYEEDNNYSFLYNDYMMQYKQLEIEYKKYDDYIKSLI